MLGWLPNRERRQSVTNRRFDFLSRYLGRRVGDPALAIAILNILRDIWRSLTGTVLKKVLLNNEHLGVCYHLDPRHIELRHCASEGVSWLRCPICLSVAVNVPADVCPTMGCTGVMQPIDPENCAGWPPLPQAVPANDARSDASS